MNRMLTRLAFFTTLAFAAMPLAAAPINVYFGGSGLYYSRFDPATGKLGQAKPAAAVKGAIGRSFLLSSRADRGVKSASRCRIR